MTGRDFPICAMRLSVALWIAAVIFTFAPQIDVATSRLFFDPVRGFWMAKDHELLAIREAIWTVCLIGLAAAVIAWACSLRRGMALGIPSRVWCFVVLLHVVGPGIVANVVLKSYWGRARPASIVEFGGTQHFTAALEPAHECLRKCSFVSGEGAMVSAMLISGLILARYVVCPKWRRGVLIVLWSVALVGLSLRVMMGRHFLSDTIFAALFVSLIALFLRPFLAPRGHHFAAGPQIPAVS